MAVTNSTILGAVKLVGSNDYQQRVPDATATDFASTMRFLFNPMNRKYYNEFINTFVQLIGTQKVHNKLWENPFAPFKGEKLEYGQTIQEVVPKWIKAHAYKDDVDDLLEVHRPEFESFYHSVNRRDRYDISVNEPELQQAAMQEYGLNKIINSIMNVPINSDNYDEYLIMMQLFSYYEQNWGFFKHKLDAVPTDDTTGKAFLTALRGYANKLTYPSSQYSPVGAQFSIPTFAKREELVLIIDADTDASIDVNTLASVFNLDKADIKYRTVVVPEIPINDAFAILTTEDFFVVHDYVYQTDSFFNPSNLTTNYYLHHWEVVSCSPAVPAILFTTASETEHSAITVNATGVEITSDASEVAPGGTAKLTVDLTGEVTENDNGIDVRPDAVTWEVAGDNLNSRTYVDQYGTLHVQKSGIDDGDTITVTGTAVYVNPDGETSELKASKEFTVKTEEASEEESEE